MRHPSELWDIFNNFKLTLCGHFNLQNVILTFCTYQCTFKGEHVGPTAATTSELVRTYHALHSNYGIGLNRNCKKATQRVTDSETSDRFMQVFQ